VDLDNITTKTVFIKNLPYSASQKSIESFFSSCGKISSVKMVNTQDGQFKGHSYMTFETYGAVQKALLLSGFPFNGRF